MFSEEAFAEALASAMEQLRTVQQGLGRIKCPKLTHFSIGLRDATIEQIKEQLADVPSGHSKRQMDSDYIYVIGFVPGATSPLSILTERLGKARKTASDFCRINEGGTDTQTLYVGRSKTLRSRLRQHLGANSQGVYAMHLLRWALGTDVEISISYMRFESKDDLLIQAIEDGLWESLRPAFGRKGER